MTGEAGTGKTQLCMSAAASAAALGHRVVYVDTSGSFSATRIKEFHRGFVTAEADSAEVEQHLNLTLALITVLRVYDFMELFKVLEELGLGLAGRVGVEGDGGLEGKDDLAAIGHTMGLLVIDSLSSLLSPVITRIHHQGRENPTMCLGPVNLISNLSHVTSQLSTLRRCVDLPSILCFQAVHA